MVEFAMDAVPAAGTQGQRPAAVAKAGPLVLEPATEVADAVGLPVGRLGKHLRTGTAVVARSPAGAGLEALPCQDIDMPAK